VESTITVVYGVQANSPAPLFRVVGGTAVSSCRPVSGQLCLGFGGTVAQVESVSGQILAGAAAVLGLHAYGVEQVLRTESAEQAERIQQAGPAQLLPVQRGRREVLLARTHRFAGGSNGISSSNGSNGSDNGTTGSKPMTPWGYRSSSPPG
jgi:hypothetical protein